MSACPRCGTDMQPGRRYEASQTVDVLVCWTCGREDPPLGRCCTQPRDDGLRGHPSSRVTRTCACGREFLTTVYDIKRGSGRFCSLPCSGKHNVMRRLSA